MGYRHNLGAINQQITNQMMSSANQSAAPDENYTSLDAFYAGFYYVNTIGIPLIVLIGVIGNTVSFLVFITTRFKSASVYLSFMNVADTGFLLSLLPFWLDWVDVHIVHTNGWCQLTVFATYVFSFLSVWVVVSFTVERFIVVFHPLKKNWLCTTRRALIVMVCFTVVSIVLYSHNLWTTGLVTDINGNQFCNTMPGYENMQRICSGIDTVITLLIPSLTLIILNSCIAYRLFFYQQTQCQLTRNDSRTSDNHTQLLPLDRINNVRNGSHEANSEHERAGVHRPLAFVHSNTESYCTSITSVSQARSQLLRRHTLQQRTTRMLLVISTIFLLLNLPSHALRVTVFVCDLLQHPLPVSPATASVLHELFQLVYCMNFAANFFLYVSTSTLFRNSLKTMWSKCISCSCRFWQVDGT